MVIINCKVLVDGAYNTISPAPLKLMLQRICYQYGTQLLIATTFQIYHQNTH